MTDIVRCFTLDSDLDVLSLRDILVAFGFPICDPSMSPNDVRDMLSDIDWYANRPEGSWVPGFCFDRRGGFHPVAGADQDWDTYMERNEGSIYFHTKES